MINQKEKENISVVMEVFMKVSGRATNSMDSAKSAGRTDSVMKDNTMKGSSMGKDFSRGSLEAITKGNFVMTKYTVLDLTTVMESLSILGSG